jgi:hypothetical protein
MANVLEKEVTHETADVTIVTTTETVAAVSPLVHIPFATVRAVVKGLAQLTGGTSTTGVTLRIRRGTLITDPLVGDAVNLNQPVIGAGVANYVIGIAEQLQNRESVQYCLTVQLAAAAANGNINQSLIEVEILNG